MSERNDDPNFSGYSWLDDEARLHKNNEGLYQTGYGGAATGQQPLGGNGSLLNPAAFPSATPPERTLVAGNGDLCVSDAQGNITSIYPYTSGVNGVSDPPIRNKGPIPPGEYGFDTRDISEGEGLGHLWRAYVYDWGRYRVPLTPEEQTNTYGREGFFIHGGSTPGSLGCIDVGANDSQLFNDLKTNGGRYRLIVK